MRGREGGFPPDRFRLPSPLQDNVRDGRGGGGTSSEVGHAARIEGLPERAARIEAGSEFEPQEKPSAVFSTTEDRAKLMLLAREQVHGPDLTLGVTYAGELYPGQDLIIPEKQLSVPDGHAYVAVTADSEEKIKTFFDRVTDLKNEREDDFAQLGFPKKS